MVEKSFRLAPRSARIQFDGRSFVLPADSDYDRDLVLEHGRYLAARYGRARIQMGGRSWWVRADDRSRARKSA